MCDKDTYLINYEKNQAEAENENKDTHIPYTCCFYT